MKAVLATLALLATLVPATSHALVQEAALCQTSDNKLQVSIQNNQGIGMQRTSNLVAEIQDANGNVVQTIPVQVFTGIQSASFGRPTYIDIATQGAAFLMQGPSTNFHNYVVRLNTTVLNFNDQNADCSVFFGNLLN